VTDLPASEIRALDVARRDDLNAAMMEAIRAYRESHSFRSPLFAPSGLRRSTYRPSESEPDLPMGFA
jgi:hypothetical protein